MGSLGGQAEEGYQPGEQGVWGPWGTQGRARIESRGPENGFHSLKCVSGAKSSAHKLCQPSSPSQAECVCDFLFYEVFVVVAVITAASSQ